MNGQALQRRLPAPLLVALLYLVGLSGTLRSFSIYHGDERFYTDAALGMARSGDLWHAQYASGEPRLEKPMLSYWVILDSLRVFGIGLWQARISFTLAIAALILLAASAARRLLGDPRAGLLAALILAGNPDMLVLGSRSTPDALLCLAVGLALDGAARVLFEGERGRRGAWQFWLGAGLAAATKGLWGFLLVAFVGIGAFLARPGPERRRRLFRTPAWLAGGALAALGIGPLFLAGAEQVVQTSGTDQLRATATLSTALRNLAEYGPAPLIHFLPWTLLVVVALASRAGRATARRVLARPVFRAALVWWLVLVLVFLFGTLRRVRYLAPAHAGLALVLVALLLEWAALPGVGVRLRRLAVGLAGFAALLTLVLALAFLARMPTLAALLFVPGSIGLGLSLRASKKEPAAALVSCGWSFLLTALAFLGVLRPTLSRSPFGEIAAAVEEQKLGPLAVDGLHDSVEARLRLLSADRIEALPLERVAHPTLVLTDERRAEDWRAKGFEPIGRFDEPGGPSTSELLAWWRSDAPGPPRPTDIEHWLLLVRK